MTPNPTVPIIAMLSACMSADGGPPWTDSRSRQAEVIDAQIVIYARACAGATSADGVRASLKADLKARTDRLARSKAAARRRIAALREDADAALRSGYAASAEHRFLHAAELEFPDVQRLPVRAEELMIESLTGMVAEADGLCERFNAEVDEARERLAEARQALELIDVDQRAAEIIGAWLALLRGGSLPQLGVGAVDLARVQLVIGVSSAFRRLLRLEAPQTFTVAELARFASGARDASIVARCA